MYFLLSCVLKSIWFLFSFYYLMLLFGGFNTWMFGFCGYMYRSLIDFYFSIDNLRVHNVYTSEFESRFRR